MKVLRIYGTVKENLRYYVTKSNETSSLKTENLFFVKKRRPLGSIILKRSNVLNNFEQVVDSAIFLMYICKLNLIIFFLLKEYELFGFMNVGKI